MDNGLTSMTHNEICERFVDTKLMNKIGRVASEAEVTVSTVHFTLAAMITDDMVDQAATFEQAAASLLGLQNFMYQTMSNLWLKKMKDIETRKVN